MRVTIIPSDHFIRRDNISVQLPTWDFDDTHIHAIQWYDDHGEIEHNEIPIPPNTAIADDSILQPYLDALDDYLANMPEE